MKAPLAALLGALLLTACFEAGPPSAQDIASKPTRSAMKDGHFKVDAVLASGNAKIQGSGEGVIIIQPKKALRLSLRAATGEAVDLILVDGKQYLRVANADEWTASDDSILSTTGGARYVGEESVDGSRSWHVRLSSGQTTLDQWVRESDGYLVRAQSHAANGSTLTLHLDRFNVGATVAAPPPPDPRLLAAKAYRALADQVNPRAFAVASKIELDANAQDLAALKADFGQMAQVAADVLAGLTSIKFPDSIRADLDADLSATRSYQQICSQISAAPGWGQVAVLNASFQTAATQRDAASNRLRADLGLPPSDGV